jgi:tetratricopeptide (TPR) repeat protein
MTSAIELYKEAYDLDFNKGDSLYAETLYKEIIERFPHSDEKEYAQVHLERIAKLKGNPSDPTFKPLRSGGSNGLAVVCFVLILFIFVGLGFGFYYGYQMHLRMDSNESVIHGLLSEKKGDMSEAEKNYEQAQFLFPRNGVAYRCLAELYLDSGKLQQAEIVRKKWELLLPFDIHLSKFNKRRTDTPQQEKEP